MGINVNIGFQFWMCSGFLNFEVVEEKQNLTSQYFIQTSRIFKKKLWNVEKLWTVLKNLL